MTRVPKYWNKAKKYLSKKDKILSKLIKRPNLICVDMGGTSFDMSLIINGKPSVTNETEQEFIP